MVSPRGRWRRGAGGTVNIHAGFYRSNGSARTSYSAFSAGADIGTLNRLPSFRFR